MPTYRQAEAPVINLLTARVTEFYPRLHEAGVTFGVLEAFATRDAKTGEPKGPALKKHGHSVAGVVKIVSHKDRVAGKADVEVILDGEQVPEWDEPRQAALLDDLLESLELMLDDEGNIRLDDSFRPRLKIRPTDYLLAGYESIAKRHGDSSLEVREMRRTVEQFGQVLQVS